MWRKGILIVLALVVAVGVLQVGPVYADDPPAPVGTAPVSQAASRKFGSLIGENGSSQSTCVVDGRPLLVTTGDFSGYRDPQGVIHSADKAVVTNASNGAFIWGAHGVNDWVQTSKCAYNLIYFGGSFTTFQGVSRSRSAAISATTFGLSSWQAPASSGTTWDIEPGDGGLFVATGSQIRRVSRTTGATVWVRYADCGVRTILPVGSRIYAGGLFNGIKSGTTLKAARGLAVMNIDTGVPYQTQPQGSIPNDGGCGSFSGANPLSLAYDSGRNRVVSCEGGIQNRLRSVSVSSGQNVWHRPIDGDGQVCLMIQGYVFVGFHRNHSPTNNWGEMGAFFSGTDGHQIVWRPSPDFEGTGANRDHRNNGIIGAVVADGYLHVTGGFNTVDDISRPKMAAFIIRTP